MAVKLVRCSFHSNTAIRVSTCPMFRVLSRRVSYMHTPAFVKESADFEQKTVAYPISFNGIGLHTGNPCNITIKPNKANAGIIFRDVGTNREVTASWRHILDSQLCTVIGMYTPSQWGYSRQKVGLTVQRVAHHRVGHAIAGPTFATVEHLLAAISGAGIDNAVIEFSSNEVPVMDGSAQSFCDAFSQAGAVVAIPNSRAMLIRVLRRVEVHAVGGRWASLEPLPEGAEVGRTDLLLVSVEVDFGERIAEGSGGRQRFEMWASELGACAASARTFCFEEDLVAQRRLGLARGGSLDNAVVYVGGRAVNRGGLRYPDEAARHKALDALGDLRLAGRLAAHYRALRPGHALTHALLRALAPS